MKTITVTEEAYENIKALKIENESFSELFNRITAEKSGNLRRLFGILKKDDEAAEKLKENVANFRKKADEDYEGRRKKLWMS